MAPTGVNSPKLLRLRDAAEQLAISERSLWTLAKRGDVPAVRIGCSLRFDPADLAAFVQKAKTLPAPPAKGRHRRTGGDA